MKNNLKLLRDMSKLTPKQLSILLNVSVHTYIAMEQEKFSISSEIIIMVSRIYKLPVCYLFEDVENNILDINCKMQMFSTLNEDDRFGLAVKNLTGEDVGKHIFKQIRRAKNKIQNEINEKTSKHP